MFSDRICTYAHPRPASWCFSPQHQPSNITDHHPHHHSHSSSSSHSAAYSDPILSFNLSLPLLACVLLRLVESHRLHRHHLPRYQRQAPCHSGNDLPNTSRFTQHSNIPTSPSFVDLLYTGQRSSHNTPTIPGILSI